MSVYINESGMCFGPFEESDLFYIEQSKIYKALGDGIRTVEFVLHKKGNEIIFVEAKSSSPHPHNQEDFDKFTDEICDKFTHSLDIFLSLILQRLKDPGSEVPNLLRFADYSRVRLKLLLIINGHRDDWGNPVADALKKKLKRQIKTWRVEPGVMNQEGAARYGLLNTNQINEVN